MSLKPETECATLLTLDTNAITLRIPSYQRHKSISDNNLLDIGHIKPGTYYDRPKSQVTVTTMDPTLPSEAPQISTYVMFDTETTGLPSPGNNPKITELCLLAITKEELVTKQNHPRVLSKLSLCLNPQKMIGAGASEITGLHNDALEMLSPFKKQASVITSFLSNLPQPVCLVAHNGNGFDFPLLRSELLRANEQVPGTVFCADSLECFRVLDGLPAVSDFVLSRRKKEKEEMERFRENNLASNDKASSPGSGAAKLVKQNSDKKSHCVSPVKQNTDEIAVEQNEGSLGFQKSFDKRDAQQVVEEKPSSETTLSSPPKVSRPSSPCAKRSADYSPLDESPSKMQAKEVREGMNSVDNTSSSTTHLVGPWQGEGIPQAAKTQKTTEEIGTWEKKEWTPSKISADMSPSLQGSVRDRSLHEEASVRRQLFPSTQGCPDEKIGACTEKNNDAANDRESTIPYFLRSTCSFDSSQKRVERGSLNVPTKAERLLSFETLETTDSDRDLCLAMERAETVHSLAESDKETTPKQLDSRTVSSGPVHTPQSDTEGYKQNKTFNSSRISAVHKDDWAKKSDTTTPTKKWANTKTSLFKRQSFTSYKLIEVYSRTFGQKPEVSHTAEDDCVTLLKIIRIKGDKFLDWCQTYAVPLETMEPMY